MLPAIMILRFELERPADIGQRTWRTIGRDIHHRVGEYWHKHFLPRHWKRGASTRYGYQARSGKYRRKKAALAKRGVAKAPNTDLLFTGRLREAMVDYADIRAFPTRFSVSMYGPKYVSMRPKNPSMPNMGAEITATTDSEQQQLADLAEKRMERLVNAFMSTKKKKTRTG